MEQNDIFNAKKWDIKILKQNDIPTTKGIYCYLDLEGKIVHYVGSAVGTKGLRGRIWGQHLNSNYLETRKDKFSKKDIEQIEKGIQKNGKVVIEKSAFRKNIARSHNLAPGQPSLSFLKNNFILVFFPLPDQKKEEIHAIEKEIINGMNPEFNLRKF